MKRGMLDTYHIRDAREILSVLPSAPIVDTTITSPPYWNLKNYGSKSQVGFGQEYVEYLDDLEQIFTGVYRVTKKTGTLWVVADTIKDKGELKLFPFDPAERLKRIGWILHDIIVWHKDKTLPWSHRGKLRNIFEYILFFSKGKHFKYHINRIRETEGLKEWWMRYPERYSPQGKAPTRTWSIPIPRQGSWGENWVRHFCPFPPELVRRIVLLTTGKGDVVLDPFAGSGVVLAQTKALQRYYVGFDLRTAYRRMFEKKVQPSILTLEKENERSERNERRKHERFSATIWKLRKTKYPRELLRLYEKAYGRLGTDGIISLSRRMQTLKIIFLFTDGVRPPRRFASRMERLKRRPPLSKYGLNVDVKACLINSKERTFLARDGLKLRENLSLYKDGKTYQAGDIVTTNTFLALVENDKNCNKDAIPTIASNVRINASKPPIG
jgi:DNA modification methylase